MTSQGTAHGRFSRAIAQRNVRGAEIAAKEMGGLSLLDALDYLAVLAELQPARAQVAAIRWHGRLELECVARIASKVCRFFAGPHFFRSEAATWWKLATVSAPPNWSRRPGQPVVADQAVAEVDDGGDAAPAPRDRDLASVAT